MIRIGVSGWNYASWRRVFYPADLPHRRELDYACRVFPSIEINGTFYSLKSPASFRRWHDAAPEGFVFAVKGARFITHMKALSGVETALANFFAQGVFALGRKLGPILWQLPARMPFEEQRIADFLALLPRDTAEAALLARRRDRTIMKGRALLEPEAAIPLRYALEVRHESFRDQRFLALLRREGVALAVSDSPQWPCFADVTADFLYLRLHGAEELYRSGYGKVALDCWAKRVRRWAGGGEPRDVERMGPRAPSRRSRDVYVYFDNDAKVRAPVDALSLARRRGLCREEIRRLGPPPRRVGLPP